MTIKKHILLENTKVFENLEVSENLGRMTWYKAVESCKKLGEGWRLPTKEELKFLCKNKEKIGGFASSGYWSSTEDDNYFAWRQHFFSGSQYFNFKNLNYYVRAVRAS